MIQLICFLIPPFISVKFFEAAQKRRLDFKKFLTIYSIFVGIANMICLGVIGVLFRNPEEIFDSNLFTASFLGNILFYVVWFPAFYLLHTMFLKSVMKKNHK